MVKAGMLKSGLLICFGLLAVSPAKAADVWTPLSKWNLDIKPVSCTLVRSYQMGSHQISLGFVAEPPSRTFRLLIAAPEPAFKEPTVVVSAPGVAGVSGPANRMGKLTDGATLWSASLDRSALSGLLSAGIIVIEGVNTHWDIPTGGSAVLAGAIRSCEDDVLQSFKIDPKEVENLPYPDPGKTHWITANDYPAEAIRSHQQGDVTIVWRIESNGEVHDCRVVESSGSRSLDTTSCNLILRRARYLPAIDRSGRPVAAWDRLTFHWKIP